MFRKLMVIAAVALGGVLSVQVVHRAPGYHLTSPVFSEAQSLKSNVQAAQQQVKTTEAKISTVKQAYQDVAKHVNADISIYNQMLSVLQSNN